MLIDKAADFFAEHGFEAGTRVLAEEMGITQPLIYRYFESKEDLINEVYSDVCVAKWRPEWETTLKDRSRPLKDRLHDFYHSYCEVVYDRRWVRFFFFAGLKELDINTRYVTRVSERLLKPICVELRAELGHPEDAPAISEEEFELVWLMQAMIFYQAIRAHIYRIRANLDPAFAIDTAIEMYLRTAPEIVAKACEAGK